MQVCVMEPGNLEQAHRLARRAAELLCDGGLVVFPTETVYGVAAAADHDEAVSRLIALKAAGDEADAPPFAVHVPDAADALRYVEADAHPALRRLIHRIFPGPVTLLIETSQAHIDQVVTRLGDGDRLRRRLYRDGLIALRCPDHPLAQAMLERAGRPILAASANTPGQLAPRDAADAMAGIGARVDLVLDGGRCRYAKPSTLVRLTTSAGPVHLDLLRPGVYDEVFLRKLMRYAILFICSGNTCRSPMAEALARHVLAEQRGIRPDQLEDHGFCVASAGVFAFSGAPATEHAVAAIGKYGLDLAGHRARLLTEQMVLEADVLFCMTRSHRQAVLDLVPMAQKKVMLLDDAVDIDDPVGSDATNYQRTAELIRRRLVARLAELAP